MAKKTTTLNLDTELQARFVEKHGEGKLSAFINEALKLDLLSSKGDLDIGVVRKRKEALEAQIAPLRAELQQLDERLLAADIKAKQDAVLSAEERAAQSDPSLRCQWCGVPYSAENPKLLAPDVVGHCYAQNGHVCSRCALDDQDMASMLRQGLSVVEIKKKMGARV